MSHYDEHLPTDRLRTRARRRLFATAVIALLLVIILPFVMDKNPNPELADYVDIRIPRERDAEGLIVQPKTSRISPRSEEGSDEQDAITESSALRDDRPSLARTLPELATKPSTISGEANVKVTPSPRQTPNRVDKPSPSREKAGRWIVQLGAFRNVKNAERLLAQLSAENVPSYSKLSADRSMTFVTAGPFNSKAAAESARAQSALFGVKGIVVASKESAQ